jgi:hypothetical protein
LAIFLSFGEENVPLRTFRLGTIILVSVVLFCCRDVDMNLVNPLTFDQTATIQEYSDQTPVGSPIYAGTVPAKNGNKDYLLSNVRVGHYLNVTGSARGEVKLSVVSGSGPQKETVVLPAGSSILTDTDSAAQLVAAFLVIGPQTGFPPDDLNDALTNVVGSVRCYTPPTQNSPFSNVVWSKPPGVLSDIVATPNPYPFPSGTVSKTADVTSGASAQVGASVPLYGSIKGNFKNSGLDKYSVQYINFGSQSKTENTKTFTGIPTALNHLSEDDKQALLAAMNVSSVICTYFNNYYVMQTLNLDVEHSKQVQSGADITGATIFTATGAYNYQADSTEKATLTNKVFNVWGDNFLVAKDPSSTTGKTVLLYQPQKSDVIPSGAGPAAATKPTS